MGLKIYDPRPEEKDWFWGQMFLLWIGVVGITVIGWAIGEWLHTGVWHW
jgi:hypothetical protein